MAQWVKVPRFDFSLDTPIGLYTVLLMNKIVYRGGIQKPNHQQKDTWAKSGRPGASFQSLLPAESQGLHLNALQSQMRCDTCMKCGQPGQLIGDSGPGLLSGAALIGTPMTPKF